MSSADLRAAEMELNQQLDTATARLRTLDEELADAKHENEQLSSSVATLRSMRVQLEEELAALVPLSSESIESAKYEANEIRKTLLENELVQAEDTLGIMAARIQDLIRQRVERDADVDNYARRIIAMQRLILRPRGAGSTSAVAEIRQLEQENRNMQEEILAIRVAAGDPRDAGGNDADSDTASPRKRAEKREQKERQIQQALVDAKQNELVLSREERIFQMSLESRIADAEQAVHEEYSEKVRQLIAKFESTRTVAMLSAKGKEEQQILNPKEVLRRAMEETRKALGVVPPSLRGRDKNPEQVERLTIQSHIAAMTTERAKTTAVARAIASQVSAFQSLLDENGALNGLLQTASAQLSETNAAVHEMAKQLEALQQRAKDETNHREQWIERDAQDMNLTQVQAILKREEEHRKLQAQIDELKVHTQRLQHRAPASPQSAQRTTDAAASAHLGSSTLGYRGRISDEPNKSNLKRSMLLDL